MAAGNRERNSVWLNFFRLSLNVSYFCTCPDRFLEYFQNKYCTHILFLHFRSSPQTFIPENNFLNVLSVFQCYTFPSVLYYRQVMPKRVWGDARPVWNYYLVHLSEYNETRSTWSPARPSVCNIELEPLVRSAHDLAYKSWHGAEGPSLCLAQMWLT